MKKYQVAYIDPPWAYYGDPNKNAAAGKHYDLMGLKDISDLPIRDILEKNAAAFVWATCPRLDYAIKAIESWGLHYRGIAYVWVKTNKAGRIIVGQGIPPTFTKPTTELLLVATTKPRGRPFPIQTMKQAQVVLSPRGRHSEKPAIFKRNIEELCGEVSKIELFSRSEQIEIGWDYWGKEAPRQDVSLTSLELSQGVPQSTQ